MKYVFLFKVAYHIILFVPGCGDPIMFTRQRAELGIVRVNSTQPAEGAIVKLVPSYDNVAPDERPKVVARYFGSPVAVSKGGVALTPRGMFARRAISLLRISAA